MNKPKELFEDTLTCPFTKRQYLKDSYPTRCSCCAKEFHDRENFWQATEALEKGDYSRGTSGYVFEYRNCRDCRSTLVTKILDKRDTSLKGERKRDSWRKRFKLLTSNGVTKEKAELILRSKK